MTVPDWLTSACALPTAFAQVREDPFIDQAAADRLPADSAMLMIASGGCSAAWLARHPRLRTITLVDPNPAQLALTRLKQTLLKDADPDMRLAVLGHTPMEASRRADILRAYFAELRLADDCLGPLSIVAKLGPDYCGRYERLFSALQEAVRRQEDIASGIADVFALESADAQSVWIKGHALWERRLAEIFDDIFALPNLIALFGKSATQNRKKPFSQHFLEQFLLLLARHPVKQNPFVWQMLRGCYPDHISAAWLHAPACRTAAQLQYIQSDMASAMRSATERNVRYQLIHLSNILDWLTDQEAAATLRAAWGCTEPGGMIIIRQLNSTLDVRAIGETIGWRWDDPWSESLLYADRSFFYRALYIGRKP